MLQKHSIGDYRTPCCSLRAQPKHAGCVQAKLVKGAVTKALQAVKEARPLSLQSSFEQRMGCLADIARSAQPRSLICAPVKLQEGVLLPAHMLTF